MRGEKIKSHSKEMTIQSRLFHYHQQNQQVKAIQVSSVFMRLEASLLLARDAASHPRRTEISAEKT
jgi:hypothetical protein